MFNKIHPIRAAVALIAWGVIIFCLVSGTEIPGELWGVVGTITGFYFASS